MSTIPTNFWASQTVFASQDPGKVTPTDDDLKRPADKITADEFRTWTREKQLAYLGNNAEMTIGAKGGEQIVVKPAPRPAVEFSVPNGKAPNRTEISSDRQGYPAQRLGEIDPVTNRRQTADFDKMPAALDPRIFMAWRSDDQLEYLNKHGASQAGDSLGIGTAGSDMGFFKASLVRDVVVTGGALYGSGNASDIPYHQLPGSSGGAASLSQMSSPFAIINGSTVTLPAENRPDGFETDPSKLTTPALQEAFLKKFSDWHSAFQVEYARNWGEKGAVPVKIDGTSVNKDVFTLKIPTSGTAILTAVTSATESGKIYILESLDKAAFAKMAKGDQDFIASTLAFLNIASKVGLRDVDTESVANLGSVSNPTGLVKPTEAAQTLITYMDSRFCSNVAPVVIERSGSSGDARMPTATAADQAAGISYKLTNFSAGPPASYSWEKLQAQKMPDSDRAYFTSQLKLLNEQLAGMGVVSPADVSRKLTELKDRFDRAFAFFDVKLPYKIDPFMGGDPNNNNDPNNTKATLYTDVISIDNNETINKGYRIFIAQEKRLSELAEERMKLVRNEGTLFGKKLDVPELVYRFQSLYNLQLEAQVVMETEEVNQQNALLKTYAKIQDVVNKTLSTFSKAEGDRYVLNLSVDELGDKFNKLTTEERLIISMFEDLLGKGQKHPLETLRKIDRPKEDIIYQPDSQIYGNQGSASNYDLVGRSHMMWSGFGTRLSEAVTIINQNSQIKMNDINSMDKQRNRHFELANSALSKMSEMINNIARAG